MLLDHCRDALADAGDTDAVAELLAAVLTQGNGASFQRAAYRRSGRLSDVIRAAAVVTEAGWFRRRCRSDGWTSIASADGLPRPGPSAPGPACGPARAVNEGVVGPGRGGRLAGGGMFRNRQAG
jgi:hypothetical protein